MKIFNFGKDNGKEITVFNSSNSRFSKIIQPHHSVHIGCIHIGPQGVVGSHPATVHQLFVVLNGQGWVVGREGIRYRIESGQAAYWEPEEMHESGSEEGMTVMVIEGEDLTPAMTETEWLEK